MATINLCVCILMALVASNYTVAEEANATDASERGFPFLLGFNLISSLIGRREIGLADAENKTAVNSSDSEHEQRLFSTSLINCNYASQPGSRCLSCRQAVRCYSSNLGLVRTCRGFLPYCNNGRCSFIRGAACDTTNPPNNNPSSNNSSSSSGSSTNSSQSG